jgi:hypothetical protein
MNTKNTMNALTAIKNTIAARDADERAFYNTMLSFCFLNDTFRENGVCNVIVGSMNSRLDRVTVEPVQEGEQLSIIVSDIDSRSKIRLDLDTTEVFSSVVNETDTELQAEFVVLSDGIKYQFNIAWFDF